MKLFQQRTRIQKFEHTAEFVKEYKIGKGDFILASRSVYETYFAPLGIEAHVEYKGKYGAGEPTDIMIAVPTTCGAGSEVSNVSITELTSIHSKLGLADDSIYADDSVRIPEDCRAWTGISDESSGGVSDSGIWGISETGSGGKT